MTKIQIVPLGGLGEIGKNMTAICCGDDIFLVDAGLAFPSEDMLGIDVVIPDVTFLRQNRKNFKCVLITHAHEDHIGGLPYLAKEFPNVPIYATKLTAALIRHKLKNARVNPSKIQIIDENTRMKFSGCDVSFFATNHSIPDSVGVVFETKLGNIVHTGDFKIDYTPLDGRRTDFQRIAQIGAQGVLAMLSDSTNAEKPGLSPSEKRIGESLEAMVRASSGRVVVATFASSLYRVQNFINIAAKLGRKVVTVGRSMENNVKTAAKLGYLNMPEGVWATQKEMASIPREQLIVITTGSQGESTSGLARMASGDHTIVELDETDTVIVSSSPIPGNEKSVGGMVDSLLKRGVHVIYKGEIHTSGHGYQEEQKLMLSLLRPKYFIPAHGEYRMLAKHGSLAADVGVERENIFICENGDIVEFDEDGGRVAGKTQAGAVLVDNSGMGDVDDFLMQDRKRLAEHGVAVIQVNCHSDKKKTPKIDVILKGIVRKHDKNTLNEELTKAICPKLEQKDNLAELKKELYGEIGNILNRHIKRKPTIVLLVNNFKPKSHQR